jgi:pimeloyl-ACP methyl ester carboxylesterase
MQRVYFISGLGADERAFQFLDLSFCNPVFVKWIAPLPGERISSYATRLREQITDPLPVIVGLSFGGMIGVEIAKQVPVKQLILLSSAKGSREIPYYLRLMRYLPLHKLVTASFLRSANQFAYRLMNITDRKDKVIFRKMMAEADDRFILWAIHEIIHWRNREAIPGILHIHGTADILLPYKYVRADHTIAGGEHLMLMMNPAEVSALLRQIITRS